MATRHKSSSQTQVSGSPDDLLELALPPRKATLIHGSSPALGEPDSEPQPPLLDDLTLTAPQLTAPQLAASPPQVSSDTESFQLDPVPTAASMPHIGPTFAAALGAAPDDRDDIARHVQEQLQRFAITGTTYFAGNRLCLASPQGIVEYQANHLLQRWERLDQDGRNRAATDAARTLAEQFRLSLAAPSSAKPKQRDHSSFILAGVAALVLGGVGLFHWLDSGQQGSNSPRHERESSSQVPAGALDAHGPSSQHGSTQQGSEHVLSASALACEASRSRFNQGGTANVPDAEGWVVELALLSAPHSSLHDQAKLSSYFSAPTADGKVDYLWKDEAELAAYTTGGTRTSLSYTPLGTSAEQQSPGLSADGAKTQSASTSREVLFVTFSGGYVDSYFREETRGRFIHLADSLTSDLGATHAALYARCAHDTVHAVGSWFRGTNSADAAAALLYFMGTYGNPIHLAPEVYRRHDAGRLDRAFAWDNIVTATRAIDRSSLATLVGTEGGMALGSDDKAVVVSFPFADSNRAARVSRVVARVTNLNR